MSYDSLTVLIPSHSLEDLPLELPEDQAEGLLNAFSVIWHPALLDAAGLLPRWARADDPPVLSPKSLVIVPSISRDWLACQWIDDSQQTGANIIADVNNREELLQRCLEPIEVPETLDDDVAADFLALGHCYLQMELLTRQMRYFSELDEARLEGSVLGAARAALAGDATAARTRLRDCFEMLLESRERFYPVDCYLVDLCLLTTDTADEAWQQLARSDRIVSYLATADDLTRLAEEKGDAVQAVAGHWRNGQQEFVGGELREEPVALLPLDLTIRQFTLGLETWEQLFGRRPKVWGRRRFGVGTQIPQLLDKFAYAAALHYVLDDGLYPDEEQGKFRWEGCDGTVVDACSRIPLAGDSASSFLRFPLRMSESMDYDHAAIVQFARWPQLRSPWLEDFHRIHRFAPVLGRFVTLSDFFQSTDTPGRLTKFKASDYLSPYLLQSVAREERDPISRYARIWRRQHEFEEYTWTASLGALISGRAIDAGVTEPHIDAIAVDPAAEVFENNEGSEFLFDQRAAARGELSRLIAGGRGDRAGCLVLNPCSFSRRAVVEWPAELAEPVPSEAVVSRHRDEHSHQYVVELPPSGFVWLPTLAEGDAPPKSRPAKVPLAEEDVLRNEFFEVGISPETGGIASLKTYGRGPNRLSQQVAFRFRHERVERIDDGDEIHEIRTFYTRMQRTSANVLSTGPGVGAIETAGTLVDPQTDELIGEFRQQVTVRRGRPLVEIDLEIDVHRQPEGDPWSCYYGCRWAWRDEDAALTASVHEGAQPVGTERFEAPHFVEIASGDLRTTILPHGMPFHRKTGPRMLDTLLVCEGETRRRFRFVIAVDEAYPMERARDCLMPVLPVRLEDGPGETMSGWLFHLDALNVQIARLMPLMTAAAATSEEESPAPLELGVGLRLRETEGRHRTVRLRCFRTPRSARQRDLLGATINQLTIEQDAVLVEVTAYEVCDVELLF